MSGIGVGTLVMPPAAALLIDAIGWRGAHLVLGIFAAIVGGGMALLVEDDPRRPARGPTAIRRFSMRNHHTPPPPASARRYDRGGSSGFVPRACSAHSGVRPFVHLVPYAIDHGIPQSSAVLLMAAIGIGSTSGRSFSAVSPIGWGARFLSW